MECYLVDIYQKLLGEPELDIYCDIKKTDGATIVAHFRTGETSGIG